MPTHHTCGHSLVSRLVCFSEHTPCSSPWACCVGLTFRACRLLAIAVFPSALAACWVAASLVAATEWPHGFLAASMPDVHLLRGQMHVRRQHTSASGFRTLCSLQPCHDQSTRALQPRARTDTRLHAKLTVLLRCAFAGRQRRGQCASWVPVHEGGAAEPRDDAGRDKGPARP